MAYIDDYTLSQNAQFLTRISIAIVEAVRTIVNEVDTTPNHAAREAWAHRAIRNPDEMARIMKWGVVVHPTVRTNGAATTDAQLQNVVDALVNPFAGFVA